MRLRIDEGAVMGRGWLVSRILRAGQPPRARRSLMAVGLVIVVGTGAACSSGGDQAVTAGSPLTTVVAKPVVFDAARARYEVLRAPPGKLVGRAPATVVDDVALRSGVRAQTGTGSRLVRSARRIRITGGPFPYGDARVLVLVDGRSVGEGQVADGGRRLTAAVLDDDRVHPGAVISYRIGTRRPVTVGVLRAGG